MSLRIAFTHAFCWPEVRRGGERYLHELAAALARRGHEVTIIAGARQPGAGQVEGVPVRRLPNGRGKAHRRERRFGRSVVKPLLEGDFDVVHSLGTRDATASVHVQKRRRDRRTVYTNLGVPTRGWDRRPDGKAHRKVVAGVDVYGCLSRYAQRCLEENFGRTGALTPGGVRTKCFRPVAARAAAPTLLYSGALDVPRKGLDRLLAALAVLARKEPHVRLWLSGPGDPSQVLAAAPAPARERTEVLAEGHLSDLPRLYSSAWATVLPSRFEAFGLVLVESLSCGTPIVVNDEGSLPELAEPGSGFLAKAQNPEDLAHACAQALEAAADPSAVERCRQAARLHDWDESVAPAIEALYMGSEPDSP